MLYTITRLANDANLTHKEYVMLYALTTGHFDLFCRQMETLHNGKWLYDKGRIQHFVFFAVSNDHYYNKTLLEIVLEVGRMPFLTAEVRKARIDYVQSLLRRKSCS